MKMNWYKKAQSIQTQTLWHISNEKFNSFDPYMTAQGIIWFAKDKNDLLNNLHGASINKQKPVYLYQCKVIMNKIAGWNEYDNDKYGIQDLINMGYNTIDLDDDVAVLSPENINIENIKEIK